MRFVTLVNELSLNDLKAIMNGCAHLNVSDMDFLESLAAHKCLIVPPWVMRANPEGGLARVARLVYDAEGNVEKAKVLVAVAKEIRRTKQRERFGGRFAE